MKAKIKLFLYCLKIDLINAERISNLSKKFAVSPFKKNIMRFTHQKYSPGLLQAMLNFPTTLPATGKKERKI